MTDREWELVAPFVPPAKRGGRRRTTDMRAVINAILCIAASGGACGDRVAPGVLDKRKLDGLGLVLDDEGEPPLSTDRVNAFKPSPKAYAMGPALRLTGNRGRRLKGDIDPQRDQIRSQIVAIPCPPPMHMVARP